MKGKLQNIVEWSTLVCWVVLFVCIVLMMWFDWLFWAKVFVTVAVLLIGLELTEKALRENSY